MYNKTEDEIIQNWKTDDFSQPLVSIRCITYNHCKYIEQTICSFLMQKTTFPFEIVIHDDCSQDGAIEIIKEYEKKYPRIIKPIYEDENQYSKGIGRVAKIIDAKLNGKYIAFCEGDDYWIDENKLQMQVDFLESNPDYGMCYTKTKIFVQNRNQMSKNIFGNPNCEFNFLLYKGNSIPSLTTCYRKDLYFKYKEEIMPENKKWLMGDYPLWLYFSLNSKLKYFDKVTAVYRVLQESASHFKDFSKRENFINSTFDVKDYYIEKYKLGTNLKNERYLSLALSASCYNETNLVNQYLSKMDNIKGFKNKCKYFILKSNILRKLYLKRLKQ